MIYPLVHTYELIDYTKVDYRIDPVITVIITCLCRSKPTCYSSSEGAAKVGSFIRKYWHLITVIITCLLGLENKVGKPL